MQYEENDYELLYLVSENNDDAKEILYDKYKNLIQIKAKLYYPYVKNYGVELNDLIQESMIGFTKAINGFKDQKNTSFSTFVNKCIDFHLRSYIRSITNNKNIILNKSISMDTPNENGTPIKDFISDNNGNDPESFFISEELKNNINEISSTKFTDIEKKVFDLRTEGFTFKEISKKLDITIKSAQHAMKRAKNKLENIK